MRQKKYGEKDLARVAEDAETSFNAEGANDAKDAKGVRCPDPKLGVRCVDPCQLSSNNYF
jgi:hypothetical protein